MQNNTIDIIILRGAPGSGKTQTAKYLSKYYPKGVKFEVDVLRQMVISVDWTNQEEHINMLQVSTGLVHNFFNLGLSPIIVVDTFSGDKIIKYLKDLYELNSNLKIQIFALYTTDDELKRRLEKRTNTEFKDFEICKKLNDDVLKIKHKTEYQINTTGLSAVQTAEIIYELITTEKASL